MLVGFEDIKFYDEKEVDGMKGWWWREKDRGAWASPKQDWEKHHKVGVLKHVHEYKVAVQAGGNQGMYPRLLAKRFDWVYTFEADPRNFQALCLNTPYHNIIKINAALTHKNELVGVHERSPANVGETQIVPGDTEGHIPSFTIDQLALPVCNIIWLDIEGSETNAILGASETIQRCSPVVVVETKTAMTTEQLEGLGYKFVERCASDHIFVKV